VLLLCLSASLEAVGLRVVSYNVGAHFADGGYPDYSLGDVGTLDFTSVRDVLARIDADVVALQEIHSADVAGNPDDLDALAAALGLPHLYIASTLGSLDTSLRVVFLSRYPFISTEDIRSPSGAKEITRHFPVVKVDVPGTTNDPLVISGHLKSGTGLDDRFRRAVEMKRLVKYLDDEGFQASDNFIILGDFNPSGVNVTFNALPVGLPSTFSLGSDISFPVSYSTNMLSYFSGLVPTRLDPRQLNGDDGTFQNGGPDGLALVVDGVVTSFLSYEGSFVGSEGPAFDLSSTNIGVTQSDNEPVGKNALGLSGSGGVLADFVWTKFTGIDHSPGAPNSGQTFSIPGLPPQGLAIDDLMVTFVPDSDGDGVGDGDDEDGDDDNDDNDGQSDDFELTFGSDPLNAASVFKMSLGSASGSYELSFPGGEGILYTVEWCDDLIGWETLSTHLGEGAEINVPLPSGEARAFFRVKAGE